MINYQVKNTKMTGKAFHFKVHTIFLLFYHYQALLLHKIHSWIPWIKHKKCTQLLPVIKSCPSPAVTHPLRHEMKLKCSGLLVTCSASFRDFLTFCLTFVYKLGTVISENFFRDGTWYLGSKASKTSLK